MKQLTLTYKGCDDWSMPVYESDGRLYVDVEPEKNCNPKVCTKYNNCFDGEPDTPVSEDIEITFIPQRYTR
jgi:hypothetical protein